MRFAADIVFEPDVVAQIVGEAHLEIARVVVRIVDGHDVLELVGADLANPLGGEEHVGVWRAGGVEEGFFVEAAGFHQPLGDVEVPDAPVLL